jgi:LmbE family N-acetylglucosaminyl deacetylase
MKNILAISPHSDDAELGCGAYLSKCVDSSNCNVHVAVICIKDELQLHQKGIVSGNTRKSEFNEAMKVLGVPWDNRHVMIHKNDQQFDLANYPKSKTITWLDGLIRDYDITDVLLPVPSFHQEHQYVYECGIAATRTTKHQSTVRNVFTYEYPAANWGPSASLDASKGGYYVDVTKHIGSKLEALKCHQSQLCREEYSLISLQGVEALAHLRGLEIGVSHAEMFYVLRMREEK